MVLSTLYMYGEGKARLAGNNYGNYIVFRSRSIFFALFVLFRKTVMSTHKTVHNKVPGQVLPYSDNTFFRNKSANSGHSRAAQPNALKTVLLKKLINITRAVLEYCTGRFVTSAPWESTSRNSLNKGIN